MSFTTFLDNFAPGGDPFATRVILGDFEFTGLEVPESATPAPASSNSSCTSWSAASAFLM